jgi:DNA-binding GntR family transcriptional regulator
MPVSRLRRSRLSQAVRSELSAAIIAGEFEPGSRISEPQLSARLGVSRAPIREALIELELRGLVEFDPTGHTRVPLLRPRDIEEIYTVRLMIDPVAASLAARNSAGGLTRNSAGGLPRNTQADTFAALEANITATKSAQTLAEVSRLDTEFHEQIVLASGNRRLLLCWNVLRDQVGLWLAQMQLRHDTVTHRTRQKTVKSHRLLLDVIKSGDADRAAEEARHHVSGWLELLPTIETDRPATRG